MKNETDTRIRNAIFHILVIQTDFSEEESAYIELKMKLSANLKMLRSEQKLTQVELAKVIKSSQSRVAKLETGDPSVSLDLIIRSLLALGTSNKDIARAISS